MSYDSRPVTLDPGRTALALRARQPQLGESYPFVEAAHRRQRVTSVLLAVLVGLVLSVWLLTS